MNHGLKIAALPARFFSNPKQQSENHNLFHADFVFDDREWRHSYSRNQCFRQYLGLSLRTDVVMQVSHETSPMLFLHTLLTQEQAATQSDGL